MTSSENQGQGASPPLPVPPEDATEDQSTQQLLSTERAPEAISEPVQAAPAVAPEAPGAISKPVQAVPPVRRRPRRRQRRPSARRWVLEWGIVLAVAALVAVLLRVFVVQAFYIPSGSMEPTLEPGDRILVFKLAFDIHPIHEGDIVVFKRPPTDTVDKNIEDLVKRVIGLPGQTISSSDGHVLINGHVLKEPYLPPGTVTTGIRTQVIPKNEYFVMGDNRGDSYDSRYFGPISRSLIVGQVVLRFWPLGRFHFF